MTYLKEGTEKICAACEHNINSGSKTFSNNVSNWSTCASEVQFCNPTSPTEGNIVPLQHMHAYQHALACAHTGYSMDPKFSHSDNRALNKS
jgi:hypothetical protein